jgi:hypothetical protein
MKLTNTVVKSVLRNGGRELNINGLVVVCTRANNVEIVRGGRPLLRAVKFNAPIGEVC